MTTMTRFVPFRSSLSDVAVLQNRLNSIFTDFARPSGEASESLAVGNFVPPVDIYEDEQKVVLKLEVPGIRQQDLDNSRGKPDADRDGRAQVRGGREGRELPPDRAAVRVVYPELHAAADGERGGCLGQV